VFATHSVADVGLGSDLRYGNEFESNSAMQAAASATAPSLQASDLQ
jgi:hypothetical protein